VDPQERLAAARKLYDEGRLADSERAYRQAIDSNEQNADGFYGVGLVRYSSRDYSGARQWFAASLERNPRHEHSLYYLGLIAERDGKSETALRLYGSVISLNPRHKSARSRLGELLGSAADDAARTPGNSTKPPPYEREWPESIVGRLTGVSRRQEMSARRIFGYATTPGGLQIFDLRVQAYDDTGRETRQHSLSLRGTYIGGAMPNIGDWIEIEPRFDRQGDLRPTKIRNLVTGESVRARIRRW
jgi:tetratricopeptide (TPR) repeat protein